MKTEYFGPKTLHPQDILAPTQWVWNVCGA